MIFQKQNISSCRFGCSFGVLLGTWVHMCMCVFVCACQQLYRWQFHRMSFLGCMEWKHHTAHYTHNVLWFGCWIFLLRFQMVQEVRPSFLSMAMEIMLMWLKEYNSAKAWCIMGWMGECIVEMPPVEKQRRRNNINEMYEQNNTRLFRFPFISVSGWLEMIKWYGNSTINIILKHGMRAHYDDHWFFIVIFLCNFGLAMRYEWTAVCVSILQVFFLF